MDIIKKIKLPLIIIALFISSLFFPKAEAQQQPVGYDQNSRQDYVITDPLHEIFSDGNGIFMPLSFIYLNIKPNDIDKNESANVFLKANDQFGTLKIKKGTQVVLNWSGSNIYSCRGSWTNNELGFQGSYTLTARISGNYSISCTSRDHLYTVSDSLNILVTSNTPSYDPYQETIQDKIYTTDQSTNIITVPETDIVPTFSPSYGPITTKVNISGLGFASILSNNRLTIGGVPVAINSASQTSIVFYIPRALAVYAGKTIPIVYTNIETGYSFNSSFTITALPTTSTPSPSPSQNAFIVPVNHTANTLYSLADFLDMILPGISWKK